ncbi:hypothetical protein BDZ89DRAFT_1255325, partial [Hymenopellis radicata]
TLDGTFAESCYQFVPSLCTPCNLFRQRSSFICRRLVRLRDPPDKSRSWPSHLVLYPLHPRRATSMSSASVIESETWTWTKGKRPVMSCLPYAFPHLISSDKPVSTIGSDIHALNLQCSWCRRRLPFNTITITDGFAAPRKFGTVWVLECGHLLDTFCVSAILSPSDCSILELSTAAERANIPDCYQPVCLGKVYSCRAPQCDSTFMITARDGNPTQAAAADLQHAPGPWTFSSGTTKSCTLTPFSNVWTAAPSYGTLDELTKSGHAVDVLVNGMRESTGEALHAPRILIQFGQPRRSKSAGPGAILGFGWGGERRERRTAVSGLFCVKLMMESESTTSKWGIRAPEVQVGRPRSNPRIWVGRRPRNEVFELHMSKSTGSGVMRGFRSEEERQEWCTAVSRAFHAKLVADSECATSKWGTRAPEVKVDGFRSDGRI